MENIYRLKKRMVYPEKLTLDRVVKKPSSASSWCSDEPLEAVTYCSSSVENGSARSRSSQNEERPGSSTQFIRERIRHLVEAFSDRTNLVRRRLELPATPSSLGSQDELEPPPLSTRPKPADIPTDDIPPETDEEKSRTLWEKLKYQFNNKVIDPQSKFFVSWMFLVALAYMYNCWMIPFRSTFPYQTPTNRPAWMFFDYFFDLVYIIDVTLIQPRIMYITDGFWIKDMKLTRQNYVQSSYFKRDLISLLPLDILYFYFGPDMVILRFPRMIKIHAFWCFFENVDRILASPHSVRIARTLGYMLYLIHLNACAYYAFSIWEGLNSNDFVFHGRGNPYIVCFYFGTKTATSIGKNPKPKKNIELMFMTFSWLMGVFVFALLIGQIREIIVTATRSQTEYRKLVDETLEYLRRLNMPPDLMRRVQMWFTFTWETQHTLDENSIMDCLPHKMKTDIAINVHIQTLNKVKLFADCDEALLRELVLQLRSVIYLPGDMICRKGDVGHEMYIIQAGRVEVLGSTEDMVLATLSEGSVFGEISLLGIAGLNRRTADVRPCLFSAVQAPATCIFNTLIVMVLSKCSSIWTDNYFQFIHKSKGYSNLFVLNKTNLNEALKHYPDAQEILNKKAKALMRKNASLERARVKPVIVIENPDAPRLLETVMQMVSPDSKTNKLLRYGSKGRPKRNKAVKELIQNCTPSFAADDSAETSFQCNVEVHREMTEK